MTDPDDEAATVTNDRAESARASAEGDDAGRWVAGGWYRHDEIPDRWEL